tara:strand:+ start:399 stop:803 length:405 start_codon:yes stop_codon:yes gene_type:complete
MKRLLLLSFLILFSCSKDSGEDAEDTPGNQIIGVHQIIDHPINGSKSILKEACLYVSKYIDEGTSSIEFSSNNKGKITFPEEVYPLRVLNFDWSFDGSRWQIIDECDNDWDITYFDFYQLKTKGGGQTSYLYFK